MKHKLILADFETEATSVILDGVTVYHDDRDKGASNAYFSASDVARALKKVLKTPIKRVLLTRKDMEEILGVAAIDEWNFDDIGMLAIERVAKEKP